MVGIFHRADQNATLRQRQKENLFTPWGKEGYCSHFSPLAKMLEVRRHMGFAHNSVHKTILKPTASNFKYFDIFFINIFTTLFLDSLNFSSLSRFFQVTINQCEQKLHYTKSSPLRTSSCLILNKTYRT